MMQDYRAQLAEKGFVKAQIKAEIEALKRAMRRRRAVAKTSEAEVEEADALADEIFVEITDPAPRATRAREASQSYAGVNTGKTLPQEPEEPATHFPDPHPSTAADGQRSIPSLVAEGAKNDARPIASPVGSASADVHYLQAEQAVTYSQFSRAPVESNPLHEQADVTTSGPYPREAASGDPEKIQPPSPGATGRQPLSAPQANSSLPANLADEDASSNASPAFSNPRCIKPETCHLAHSEDCCFDCLMEWAKRPKDEQIRLWREAHEAVA
jgi:hypothetical protein